MPVCVYYNVVRLFVVMPAVVVRQRKAIRRKHGQFIYFEDNAGVIVNNKGEMKGEPNPTSLCYTTRRGNNLHMYNVIGWHQF